MARFRVRVRVKDRVKDILVFRVRVKGEFVKEVGKTIFPQF